MVNGFFRAIALLIGAVLVLGGGVCTLVGVPTGVMALFNGGASAGLGVLLATVVGFVVLLIGLRLLKFGRKGPSVEAPTRPTAL
jgi:hypothetical protein